MKIAILFPGQGSQFAGMGKGVFDVDNLSSYLDVASDVTGRDMKKLMFEGPEEELTLTEVAQPAILTHSFALYSVWKEVSRVKPHFLTGHSLGEYTAALCAGVMEFEDAVKLVHMRGKFMQEAVPQGEGSMAAVIGLSGKDVEDVVSSVGEGVEVANYNAHDQIVISGKKEKVEEAAITLKERGAKRVVFLKVSAPFHTTFMKPAQERLAGVMDEIELKEPEVPVVSNVTARPATTAHEIKELLLRQITSPVRWVDIVEYLYGEGVRIFVELGPGKVLSGLVKRILKGKGEVKILNAETVEGVKNAAEEVSGT